MLAGLVAIVCHVTAQNAGRVVADLNGGEPLSNASVFDRHGNFVGVTSSNGRLPYVVEAGYPLTIRYLGFEERRVEKVAGDTVFLRELPAELPEVVIESRHHKVLHLLAYVREYSTMSTWTDTISLFREKMVDYMLPVDKKTKFKGWSSPRVLASRSYYRFTDSEGLDSVSDRCGHHFSWADWMGIVSRVTIPGSLRGLDNATDTVRGKHEVAEVWTKKGSRLSVDINPLADTVSRRWIPGLSRFFHKGTEFDRLQVRFNYDNVAGDSIMPVDLAGYSFNIESNGRGHWMFMFNRLDDPCFVSTYGEVYVIDKEYLSVKDAKKWERRQKDISGVEIYEPQEAPELQPAIQSLVDRVNLMNHDRVRLDLSPDRRLVSRGVKKLNIGQAVLQRINGMLGIDHLKAKRQWNRQWKDMRSDMRDRNQRRYEKQEDNR